jgi:WD40 repeat protein
VRVGFSADGKWFLTAADELRLWATGSWQESPWRAKTSTRVFAFSPNQDLPMLAVETGQGVIQLLDPETGKEFARLENPDQDHAGFLCFSQDGSQLVVSSGADSGCVHIWDLRCLHAELDQRGLDWVQPPFPPAPDPKELPPLQVTVDTGKLARRP